MPTYDYKCGECGFEKEVFQKITDEPLRVCPSCERQAFNRGPGGGCGLAVFSGSDYYINDYGARKQHGCSSPECCSKD